MVITVRDVSLKSQNPGRFTDEYVFDIVFDSLKAIDDDLEWKLIYVGSADDEKFDQELTSVLVGPIPAGTNQFTLTASAPDHNKIPKDDLLGVTVLLLTCSFHDQEFLRVGYYVSVYYDSAELQENPPAKPELEKLVRSVVADKPRVTRFEINWDGTADPDAPVVAAPASAAAAATATSPSPSSQEPAGMAGQTGAATSVAMRS